MLATPAMAMALSARPAVAHTARPGTHIAHRAAPAGLGSRATLPRLRAASDAEDAAPAPEIAEAAEAAAAAAEAAAEALSQSTAEAAAQSDEIAAPEAYTAAPAPAPAPAGPAAAARAFLAANPVAYWSLVGAGVFLAGTFVIALVRSAAKGFTSQGKRSRTVNKNKAVVDELGKYLPGNPGGLTGAVVAGIRLRTGFSTVEIFRKYLWFLLRERKFDPQAVADLVVLKTALGLSDDQVAEALNERAKRVYDKYGAVMLDTTGMSPAGIERKATARALFSKMLFLVECEDLLASEAAATVDLRDIFGATEDDAARLRIASLYEVDLEAMMGMPAAAEQGSGSGSDGEQEEQQGQ